MKKCSKCKELKPLTEFYKDKRTESGLYSGCKKCHNKYKKELGYYKDYRIKKPEYYKDYRRKNKDHLRRYYREYRRNWIKQNPEIREYQREYQREWRKQNQEKKQEQNKEYRKNNPKKYREYKKEYRKKVSKIPSYRINTSISLGIWKSLKGNKSGRRWETLTGYTLEDLMKHLESQFEPWMSWDNYGKWHIDHIKPKSLFKYENAEDPEFKKCWALENLQPLEARENLIKRDKIHQ